MYTITEKLNEKQTEQLMNLYEQCWWAENRNIQDVKHMLANSLVIGVLTPGNDLIGFARILTDGVYKALILDVVVDEKYRGKGIGAVLFNAIVSNPKAMQVKHLELYCKDEMIPFYEKWGFTAELSNLKFMRKDNRP